jgi:hypothetical protein
MIEGRHYLLSFLKKKGGKNLLLYNHSLKDCYKGSFHKSFFNYLQKLNSFFDINYLAKSATSLGALDLSLDRFISKNTKVNHFSSNHLNLIYYIGCNQIKLKNSFLFKNMAHKLFLYQNSHGDNFFWFVDFFLPSYSYLEKLTGSYINCFGILRKTRQHFFREIK